MSSKAPLPPEMVSRRRRNVKRRLVVYGSLVAVLWGLWVYQPYEYDFIPRRIPNPNPPVDPDSKTLFSPKARILVVTAHPDDAEFYIAGSLLKLAASGAEIHMAVCTDGDKSYYPWGDPSETRRIRRAEQVEAAAHYGCKDVVFFGHPDGRLRVDEPLVQHLTEEILRVRPNYVFAFDGEYPPRMSHQDHRRSGDGAQLAARRAGLPLWLMRYSTIAADYTIDITSQWEQQKELLKIHKSQFHDNRLEMVTNMVESNAVEDGERISTTYAEGFRCTRIP